MHQQTIFQLALLILAILTCSESAKPAVWEFTSSDVSKLNEGEWLFEVYASWCGFCKKFAPMYEEIAKKLPKGVQAAKIDGDIYQDVTIRFQVSGFPSLFYIRNGEVRMYEGDRSEEAILKFVKGDYKSVEPFAGWMNPLGLVGSALGYLGKVAVIVNDLQKAVEKDYNIGSTTFLVSGFITLCIVSIAATLFADYIISTIWRVATGQTNANPPATNSGAQQKQVKTQKVKAKKNE